ncbi:MAG: class I mannose-6-phosphate isomerase [Provencibacterium sp.]|jgi:mannose-6-phosphate isomerase|nr:class I mannose-6-phosphate isomerase [Provencibacterium sp.]
MEPFKLGPAFKDYLWGGESLCAAYGKQTALRPVAESWELSCHPDGESRAVSGPEAGKTLRALFEAHGEALAGRRCARFQDFPVLVKLIDAARPLSIQVHPSDEYALKNENSFGKTEMWIILDAQPDSFLYYGFNREVSAGELREAIENNRLEELLGKRPVRRGDVVFIPAGMLHAIGAGIVLCEVQQNSNLTYRVYDYGRLGADGKPRPLHVEKALAVLDRRPASGDFTPAGEAVAVGGGQRQLLAECPYFTVHSLKLDGSYIEQADGESFCCLTCIEGQGELSCGAARLSLEKGESVFIPAGAGEWKLQGRLECIQTGV